jgi:hypothetical protein
MLTHAQRRLVLVGLLTGCGLLSQAQPAQAEACCAGAIDICNDECHGTMEGCDMLPLESPFVQITCQCGDLTPVEFIYVC